MITKEKPNQTYTLKFELHSQQIIQFRKLNAKGKHLTFITLLLWSNRLGKIKV